jgi:hypothetical protein
MSAFTIVPFAIIVDVTVPESVRVTAVPVILEAAIEPAKSAFRIAPVRFRLPYPIFVTLDRAQPVPFHVGTSVDAIPEGFVT